MRIETCHQITTTKQKGKDAWQIQDNPAEQERKVSGGTCGIRKTQNMSRSPK